MLSQEEHQSYAQRRALLTLLAITNDAALYFTQVQPSRFGFSSGNGSWKRAPR
ncbi:hypothetical protein V22_20220 [Calycomorphotria hydatis]|uniref:Uncharacterized protein n=1 Tax=Calycomorphotria hydatis TaxID=2528027 RepID=A0A517T8S2_9PLAN|nr:hypothetical protein V22_20220 [Calycomorphotria hydatis]